MSVYKGHINDNDYWRKLRLNARFQLTVDGLILEIGQNVLLIVEENKQEPEPAPTLLLLMVEFVTEKEQKLKPAILTPV